MAKITSCSVVSLACCARNRVWVHLGRERCVLSGSSHAKSGGFVLLVTEFFFQTTTWGVRRQHSVQLTSDLQELQCCFSHWRLEPYLLRSKTGAGPEARECRAINKSYLYAIMQAATPALRLIFKVNQAYRPVLKPSNNPEPLWLKIVLQSTNRSVASRVEAA